MKYTNILHIAAAFLIAVTSLQAQDIHFSQFYASPLNLNPATTGVLSCDLRFSAIYRNQWASVTGMDNAFSTFSAGVETRFAAGKDDYWGLGMNLWADRAGASRLSTVQGSISASYIKKLGGRRSNNMYLVAGGSIGFFQKSFSLLELQFGEQWNGDAFDGSSSTGENNLAGTNLVRPDLSAGLFWWMALDKDDKSNIYAGLAFHHLTAANISFGEQGFAPLYMKTTIHAGADIRLQRRFAIVPNVVMMFQGPSRLFNVGTSVKFDFSKRNVSNQAFEIGPMLRLVSSPTGVLASDAVAIIARMRYGSNTFGVSYDVNVSRLRPASNMNGAFEVSYVYTLCGVRNRALGCPTF